MMKVKDLEEGEIILAQYVMKLLACGRGGREDSQRKL